MPILAKETACWPPDLLDQPFDQLDPSRRWWALYSKARQEKSIVRYLEACGVSFYLPLVPKVSLRRGRRWESFIPLFGGYLFLFGTPDERLLSLKSNRISRTLEVADQERLHRDLQQVQQAIDAGVPLTVEERLEAGRAVRVHSGPLAGLEGRVLYRCGAHRLVITVDFLQRGVSAEVDDFFLEPLD